MKKFVIDGAIGPYQFSMQYVREMLKGTSTEAVEVNICSLGGDVNHALDIHDQFAVHGNVTIVYTGLNASAATLPGLSAKKVIMSENSLYLIHKPMFWIDEWGNMNEDDIDGLISSLEKKKAELAKFTMLLARMYKDKTGMSIKDVITLMKEQTWLTAEMAKEKKLVDEIFKPAAISNYLEDSNLMTMVAASGYPVPPRTKPTEATTDEQPEAYNETKLINKLRKIFNPIDNTMKKQFTLVNEVLGVEKLESTSEGVFVSEAQIELFENKFKADRDAIAAKAEENKDDTTTPDASKDEKKPGDESKPTVDALAAAIATLKADLAEARKAPGAAPAATHTSTDALDKTEDINATLENMTMAERIEFLKK